MENKRLETKPTVTVSLIGRFRELFQSDTVSVELNNGDSVKGTHTTIKDILIKLSEKLKSQQEAFQEFKSFFHENWEPKRSLLLLYNDQEIRALDLGIHTPVKPQDTILLVPTIHGG